MKDRHYLIVIILIFSIAVGCVRYKYDINKCSLETLTSIEGIGDKRAMLIIENRPYETMEKIESINGIGEATLKKLKHRTGVY